MKNIAVLAVLLLAAPAAAAADTIHQFNGLALSPAGDRTAAIESDDPGGLAQEPHGQILVRDAAGKVIAHYDPCAACRYANPVFSPKGDALVFLATDDKAGKVTLYRATSSKPQALATVTGVANTPRFSPDGSRIALLVTLGAHKKTGATQAAAPQVGEIGESQDEQRIAIVPASGGALKPISPADTYIYEYSWAPDGKGFAVTAAKGNGDDNWWIASLDYVDAASGALRVIAKVKTQIDMPRISPDGKSLAFIGGLMSDWGSVGGDIYTVAFSGGEPVDITPGYKGTFRGHRLAGFAADGDGPGRRQRCRRRHRSHIAKNANLMVEAGDGGEPDIRQSDRFFRRWPNCRHGDAGLHPCTGNRPRHPAQSGAHNPRQYRPAGDGGG